MTIVSRENYTPLIKKKLPEREGGPLTQPIRLLQIERTPEGKKKITKGNPND